MKSSIQQFLNDLYQIDPTLRAHEAALIPLITTLMKEDPSTAPDSAFIARLRMQLTERAALQTGTRRSFLQKLTYVLGGAVTAAVIIPLAIIATNQRPLAPGAPLFSNSVEATGKNAFGSLNDVAANTNAPAGEEARMQGGGGGRGGGAGVLGTDAAVSAMVPSDQVTGKMIAPWPMVQYQYVFSGALTGLDPTVSVYKKNSKQLTIPMSALADRLNLGGMDMGSFDGMNIENVSFTQRTPFGYQIHINLRDASVSIDANWEQWPQSKCQTESCYEAERVKIGDVPADAKIIAIAQAFANDHGIDLSEYGSPEVENSWKMAYELAADTRMAYVPDVQRVIFPQLIDGKPVYDQSGTKTGLSISVHVKHLKVMSVWGIADRSYIKSDYVGVTDESAIQKFLSTVDNYFYGDAPSDTKKVTVVLGKPTISYAMYYRYADNKNEELLVPALIFPVDHVEGDENAYYRQQVVVPLAQDMLDEQFARPPIMPMMKGGPVEDPAVSTPAVEPTAPDAR